MAILAAVLVPTITNKINDANKSSAETSASSIAHAIQSEIVSVLSGAKDTNNKYVKSTTGGTVEGIKDTTETSKTVTEGSATIVINYTADDSFTVKATVSGQESSLYTIKVADGSITKA